MVVGRLVVLVVVVFGHLQLVVVVVGRSVVVVVLRIIIVVLDVVLGSGLVDVLCGCRVKRHVNIVGKMRVKGDQVGNV